MTAMPAAAKLVSWRTPVVIALCGCLISMMSFGPRSILGLFLTPQSQANGWDRDVFGLAIAIQNILWGLGQPFAGMLADRFGIMRVLCGGAILYAVGLAMMAYSTTPLMLDISAGVLHRFRARRLAPSASCSPPSASSCPSAGARSPSAPAPPPAPSASSSTRRSPCR